jgi:polysaccharide biosynthesis protein PslH
MSSADGEPHRKSLLFVTPVLPRRGGIGMTMRAGHNLEVLSDRFDVSILLVNQAPLARQHRYDEDAPLASARIATLPDSRLDRFFDRMTAPGGNRNLRLLFDLIRPPGLIAPRRHVLKDAVRQLSPADGFDAIFVFRTRIAPIGWALRRFLKDESSCLMLDTDDIDSDAVRSFIEIQRRHLGRMTYWSRRLEVLKLRASESRWFRRFHRVYVCSKADRATLAQRYPHLGADRFRVLPNVLRLPSQPLPSRTESHEPTLLFVGTMSYAPNIDAMRYFCGDILPILRRRLDRSFRLSIVGRNPPAEIMALQETHPEICVHANVPDLAEHYARADVVIVPLRMGGGTRIKILEAMGYGRPIVSTSVGAEGLEFADGAEIMIADDGEAFASRCAALLTDPDTSRRIADRAFERCHELYSLEGLKTQFRASAGL